MISKIQTEIRDLISLKTKKQINGLIFIRIIMNQIWNKIDDIDEIQFTISGEIFQKL